MRAAARLGALRRRWLAVAEVLTAWGAVVDLVATLTAGWPAALAAVAGSVPASDLGAMALAASDEPRRSWIPVPAGVPLVAPVLRPRLEGLADRLAAAPESAALERLLCDPPSPARLAMPATTAEARAQFREASAATKLAEAALLEGPHVSRAVARAAITDAQARFRGVVATWFSRADDVAGRPDVALKIAEALRDEAVGVLRGALDGLDSAAGLGLIEAPEQADQPVPSKARPSRPKGRSKCRK